MAKKHVVDYYKKVEAQYYEMLKCVKEYDKAYADGFMTFEQLTNAKKIIEPLVSNYKTLSYIMFLLNSPIKKEKNKKYIKQNKDMYNYFAKISDVSTINDNEDILKNFKEYMKKDLDSHGNN